MIDDKQLMKLLEDTTLIIDGKTMPVQFYPCIPCDGNGCDKCNDFGVVPVLELRLIKPMKEYKIMRQ